MKKKFIFLIIVSMTLSLSIKINLVHAREFPPYEWPLIHHDQSHSRYTISYGPSKNTTLWVSHTNDYMANSSPVVLYESLYIGSQSGNLYHLDAYSGEIRKIYQTSSGNLDLLDAYSGEIIRTYQTSGQITSFTIWVHGYIYLSTEDGYLHCIEDWGFEHKWSIKTGSLFHSSPSFFNDFIYIGSIDGRLYCLDAYTGYQNWNFTTGGIVDFTPAISSDKVYVGTNDGNVYCLNATTGEEKWSTSIGDKVHFSPTVVDDKVYIVGYRGKMYCLDAQTGVELWRITTSASTSPAVAYGYVYFGSIEGSVICLDANTGVLKWDYKTGNKIHSSPAVAAGGIYLGSNDGKIYCINAFTGDLTWEYNAGIEIVSSPVIAYGFVYIAALDGTIYCFGNSEYSTNYEIGPPWFDFGNVYQNSIVEASFKTQDVVDNIQSPKWIEIDWPGGYFINFNVSTKQIGTFSGDIIIETSDGRYAIPVKITIKNKPEPIISMMVYDTPFDAHSTYDPNNFYSISNVFDVGLVNVSYYLSPYSGEEKLPIDYPNYDVILLAAGGLTSLPSEQLANLKNYVLDGGTLLIWADKFWVRSTAKSNEITKDIGILIKNEEYGHEVFCTKFRPHLITNGVNTIRVLRPSPVILDGSNPDAKILASLEGSPQNEGVIAISELGLGNIIVFGDSLWWYSYFNYGINYDNSILFLNLINFIAEYRAHVPSETIAEPEPEQEPELESEPGARKNKSLIKLEVPYQFQDGTNWCGPASLAMVLRYYGYQVHVWDIAKDLAVEKRESTTLGPSIIYKDLFSYTSNKYTELDIHLGKYNYKLDQILLDIKNNITNEYPVIVAVEKDGKGHAIVVTGFNETGFYVNDPGGALPIWTGRSLQNSINFYVTNEEILEFLSVPSSFEENRGTLLICKGISNPLGCTLQYISEEIVIGIKTIINSQKVPTNILDLDKGLIWKNNKETPKLDYDDILVVQVYASNHHNISQELISLIEIIGEDGVIYHSNESEPIIIDDKYEYYSYDIINMKLNDYLDKSQKYRIVVSLLDEFKNKIDEYTTPNIEYINSQELPDPTSVTEPSRQIESRPGGISGFPFESILVGIIFGMITLRLLTTRYRL